MRWLLGALAAVVVLSGCASTGSADSSERELAALYADMGLGYLKRGENDRALEKLQRALELDPDLPRAHHYVAELYNRLEQPGNAEKHYRRALELSPFDPHLQNNFGAFLCSLNRGKEAEEYFLKAARNPQYGLPQLAYENAGRCILRSGDEKSAEGYFRRALAIDPRLPNSLFQMAILQFGAGDFLGARAYLERYLEVGPRSPEALYLGIQVERQLGATAMAENYRRQLRTRYGTTDEGKRLLRTDGDLVAGGGPKSALEPILAKQNADGSLPSTSGQ